MATWRPASASPGRPYTDCPKNVNSVRADLWASLRCAVTAVWAQPPPQKRVLDLGLFLLPVKVLNPGVE